MPFGVSINASPPESSNSRFQRVSAAITRRASARSGVTSAADLPRCRASRIATAIASASISRVGRLDDGEASPCRQKSCQRDIRLDQTIVPLFGRARRPHRLSRPAPRGPADLVRPGFDIAALDAEAVQQSRASRIAWMVGGGLRGEPALRVPDAADRLPGFLVEIGVEPGQHHRALFQAGHGVEEFLRSPASNRSSPPQSPAPHDARSGARLPPRSGGRAVAAGSILPISFRCSGHALRAMRRNSSECCQYLSNWSGTSLSSASQATPRVTMSSISRARSPASASVDAGPTDHERRRYRAFCPRCNQMRQGQAALQLTQPRRNVERRHAAELFEPSENASSSSSMSPSATMRGRIAASVFSSSRKISRASRPARRVGR